MTSQEEHRGLLGGIMLLRQAPWEEHRCWQLVTQLAQIHLGVSTGRTTKLGYLGRHEVVGTTMYLNSRPIPRSPYPVVLSGGAPPSWFMVIYTGSPVHAIVIYISMVPTTRRAIHAVSRIKTSTDKTDLVF